ncbi:hypothetical protein PTKIN_Ptkin02bG0104400 [Pterospermum kingtungense]
MELNMACPCCSKDRTFWLRALHNILPTYSNLVVRGIQVEDLCCVCSLPGFNHEDRSVTCGMVLRNCQGGVILSVSKGFKGFHSPLQAEFQALLFSLEIVYQEGLLAQQVESHSSMAITQVQKRVSSTSEWLSLVLDINQFSILYGVHSFSYIRKVANELAHNIAKTHSFHEDLLIWRFMLPHVPCT